MRQTSEIREKKTYTFRNEDSSPRVVVVEHPARPNYELRSEARPDETTAGWMRFRLRVDPKQTASLVVGEARPQERTYAISSIDSQQLQLFVRQQSIDKAVEDALQKVLTQKIAIASLEQQKESRDDEMTKIFDDQQRLRENVKSLKGSAEEKALLQRYTQQLNEQETRLESLRKDIAGLEEQAAALRSALDKTIDGLVLDVKL
jgi:septation ring formation regulator EzrA